MHLVIASQQRCKLQYLLLALLILTACLPSAAPLPHSPTTTTSSGRSSNASATAVFEPSANTESQRLPSGRLDFTRLNAAHEASSGAHVHVDLQQLVHNASSAIQVHTHPCKSGTNTLPDTQMPGPVYDPLGGHTKPVCNCSHLKRTGIPPDCTIGDLSGRFGMLAGSQSTIELDDAQLDVDGVHGILGRSVVVQEPSTDGLVHAACANISDAQEERAFAALEPVSGGDGFTGFFELRCFNSFAHSTMHVLVQNHSAKNDSSKDRLQVTLHERTATNDACGSGVLQSCSDDGEGGSREAVHQYACGELTKKHGNITVNEMASWGEKLKLKHVSNVDVRVASSDDQLVLCGRLIRLTREQQSAQNTEDDNYGVEREVSRRSFYFGIVLAVIVGGSILVYAGQRASRHCYANQTTRNTSGSMNGQSLFNRMFRYNKLDKSDREREVEL